MTPEEILEFTREKSLIKLSLNREFMGHVIEATNFLDEFYGKVPLRIRLLALESGYHSSESFPRCPSCGKPVGFDKVRHSSFLKFCSNRCSSNRDYLSEETLSLLSDREWMWEKRITRKMSYDSIAAELGVSSPTVEKWCTIHSIPRVRYSASPHEVQERLSDREWLFAEHKTRHRKLDDIAGEIGSTKSTLSVHLKNHSIQANDPNSYDRTETSSKECLQVHDFLRDELGVEGLLLDNRSMFGIEVDILDPVRKIGIEYDGLFSHIHRPGETSESRIKGKNYHLRKTEIVEASGFQLIHLFSDEWLLKQDIVKSMLRSRFGKSPRSVFARKCSVVAVSSHRKSEFMRVNHIQGNCPSSLNLGLECDGELVSVMSFYKSTRNRNYDWELVRFASTLNTGVPGGFSKLLSAFTREHSGKIISYADRRWSQGNVYLENGFRLVRKSTPNYFYVDSKFSGRLHRANFMKKRIAPGGDDRPEWMIMQERGYHRIWDCGHLVFELNSGWNRDEPC